MIADSLPIGRRVGRGASAEVFASTCAGQPVLVKWAREAAFAETLAREGRALVHLRGDAVVADAGWFEAKGEVLTRCRRGTGRPALVLTTPVGATLQDHLGPLDAAARVAAVRGVVATIAAELAVLHEAGLAHGDVKPENVVVDAGAARLIDLGLAGPSGSRRPTGATPRYLAREDADLGDGRARDLFALGLTAAELSIPALREEPDLARAVRRGLRSGDAALDAVVLALTTPSPEARPGAVWVHDALGGPRAAGATWRRARVRAAYLRAYAPRPAARAPGEAHPTLTDHLHVLARLEGLSEAETDDAHPAELAPLDAEARLRLLARVTGQTSLSPHLGAVPERALYERLLLLVERHELRGLSARALHDALLDRAPEPEDELRDVSEAELALALGRVPVPKAALLAIEAGERSAPLAVAAARALRRQGEIGRALALIARVDPGAHPIALAVAAEVQRQSGALDRAAELAQRAGDVAIAARVEVDRGAPERALALLNGVESSAALQVAALASAQIGQRGRAVDLLARAALSAADSEDQARLEGLRGYVLAGDQPEAAFRAYELAAEHARLAGAPLDEATYLTGVSATGADCGYFDRAARASERAGLLWESLGREPRAARALLNAAAVDAMAGRTLVARSRAFEARRLSRLSDDERAAAFALLVAVDAGARGPEVERELIDALVGSRDDADEPRFAARALTLGILGAEDVARVDARVERGAAPVPAAVDWVAARATALLADPDGGAGAAILSLALRLIDAATSLAPLGAMAAAARELARHAGRGDAALAFGAAQRRAAELLLARCGDEAAPAVRALPWVAGTLAAGFERPREQVARLEALVRSLAGATELRDLLRDVLDALVAWTGVERGLFLLRAPDGRLVVRAGRNLAERDLSEEERGLSRSLAQAALERGEPVVATDADGELGTVHQSVHLLKLRSVLAVPLFARGQPVGVVYLDDRRKRGAFGPEELDWVRTLSTLAAATIDRAMAQAKLARALRKAARREREVSRDLASAEIELGAARRALASERGGREGPFAAIVGESEAIVRTIRVAERVASSTLPVLLAGESGSGKELFARAIHEASARRRGPFISENVSAIPEGLLESTLFGHVRGAFTGADHTRVGLFEAADGGTLFLDEVGEMSLAMQTKLLRVLEDGVVHPLGTERTRRVDVRLVAATHRNLSELVAARQFREDLYYRLGVVTLAIPPLRDRLDDLPLIVRALVAKHAPGRVIRIADGVLDELLGRAWPGNVRQLENEIRRALVFADDTIEVRHVRPIDARPAEEAAGLDLKRRVDLLEAALVREALAKTHGNQSRAAVLLGVSRFGLQKMIKRLGLTALTRG